MINQFTGKFEFLSNFSSSIVFWDNIQFPTVENGYQAAKCQIVSDMKLFVDITPGQAKRLGRNVSLRFDWESVKVSVMHQLLLQKFKPGSELAKKLLSTGDQELVEGNMWGDKFWGVCLKTNTGLNILGKLLMNVRQFLYINQQGKQIEF